MMDRTRPARPAPGRALILLAGLGAFAAIAAGDPLPSRKSAAARATAKLVPKHPKPGETLPTLNLKVATYAVDHVGEQVGDGICTTLAVRALDAAGARRYPFRRSGDYVWGEPVADLRKVIPGDILQFRDAVFSGTKSLGQGRWQSWRDEYPHHTAVVVKVADGGKLVTICHQNVGRNGDDPADHHKVRQDTLRMASLREGGRIWAYRPTLNEAAGDPSGR